MHDLGDGLQEQDEKLGPSKGSFDQGILSQNGLTFQGAWFWLVQFYSPPRDAKWIGNSLKQSFGDLCLPRLTTTTSTRVQSITQTSYPRVSGCETMDIDAVTTKSS